MPYAPATPDEAASMDHGGYEMFETLSKYGLSDFHLINDETCGLQAIIAIHDTTLGPAIGGCRFVAYPDEQAAFEDAARLAQCMSYKAALAGLSFGGGKAVIMQPTHVVNRKLLFTRMGDFIATLKGHYITAMDSGTTLLDMDTMATRTPFISSSSKIGDCSPYTAEGLYQGMTEAFNIRFSSSTLSQARIAIQGLGHVGMALAERLHRAGADLIVSDLDPRKTQFAEQRFNARVVVGDAIYQQACEIFSPCGLGGIINVSTIPHLRCAIIAGAANNQLTEDSDEELLRDRGILYVPDFAINAGGLIYAAMRFSGENQACINEKLRRIPSTIRKLLTLASVTHGKALTPLQTALLFAQQRIADGPNTAPPTASQESLSKRKQQAIVAG